jgi:hypothetical protein
MGPKENIKHVEYNIRNCHKFDYLYFIVNIDTFIWNIVALNC